jgi:hypothetical protein
MDITPEQAHAAVEHYGGQRSAAEALGVTRSLIQRRLRALKGKPKPDFTALPVPDDELSYDELKAYRKKVYERKRKAKAAARWIPVTFSKCEPTAIVVIGDPHVDDDGCDWTQLDRDTQTIIETPGMYAGSIGDNINNWVGRLTRLYANQSTTETQAWRLAEGWIRELADPGKLVFMVRGNHDMWSGSGDPLNWIMRSTGAVDQSWQAQMEFRWPGAAPVRMWASHDFKGHSQYNPLHAQKKKHLWHGGQADIYIAGHRHHWALSEEEDEAGKIVHFGRARGYKAIDSYADVLGHAGQSFGASIAYVIDPRADGVKRIRPFPCVQQAADFVTFLRDRA